MLDKANAKWARSCEIIDDFEALASLSKRLHYYDCFQKKKEKTQLIPKVKNLLAVCEATNSDRIQINPSNKGFLAQLEQQRALCSDNC